MQVSRRGDDGTLGQPKALTATLPATGIDACPDFLYTADTARRGAWTVHVRLERFGFKHMSYSADGRHGGLTVTDLGQGWGLANP
jgi:hypothetical protein